jgi:hypothetical protein
MSAGAVVHLVWAPLGDAPLERFLASYERFSAGAEHRLVVVFKEFREPAALAAARARFADIDHEEVLMPEPALYLVDYPHVARTVQAPTYLFLNSNSELIDDGWLAKPLAQLKRPEVGLVGATGSYEGSASSLAGRLLRRRALLPFPNPHIRTTAFRLERELCNALDWGDATSKAFAWQVENGPHGLTRQVQGRGLEAVVVGRDGKPYPVDRWGEAAVFRSGEQRNLLVADNRTRDFAEGDARYRRKLTRLAWGPSAA